MPESRHIAVTLLLTAVIISGLLFSSSVRGDIIYLKNGNEMEGEVLERSPSSVKFKTGFATVEFDMDEVQEIAKGKSFLDVYRTLWIAADHDDASQKLKLAEWAKRHNLDKEADLEYQQILLKDPDNRTVRMRLGYVKLNRKWVTREEANLSKGLIHYDGKWMTPQERNNRRDSSLKLKTRERTSVLFRQMSKAEPYEREKLLQEVLKMKNAFVAPAVVRFIDSSHDSVREAATQALGVFKDASVVPQLVDLTLEDESELVRRQAALAIKAIGGTAGIARLTPHLSRNQLKSRRYRAAQALGEIENPRTIPYLIEGLYVKIKIISGLNPFNRPDQVSADSTANMVGENSVITKFKSEGERNTASSGLTEGTKSNVEYEYSENTAALDALKRMTGKNFEYSKPDWRTWWSVHQNEVLKRGT